MSAWDSGPFDNDDAADFADRLNRAPDWATVRGVLDTALAADYLDVSVAGEAVGAVAVIAAAWSGDRGLTPNDLHESLRLLGEPPTDLRVLASEALVKVAEGSELAELWAESEEGDQAWVDELSRLGQGLAKGL